MDMLHVGNRFENFHKLCKVEEASDVAVDSVSIVGVGLLHCCPS